MKIRRILPLTFILGLGLALAAACGPATGNAADQINTDAQLSQYQNVGLNIHYYTYSWERWELLTVVDFRATKLENTWSVLVADGTGEPIEMCASKGFPIPYSTEFTNPLAVDRQNSYAAVIGQMDPYGDYPSQNTAATWILCVQKDGSLALLYSEPHVIGHPWPVEIVFDQQRGMYRIARTGDANSKMAITQPDNIIPQIVTDPSKLPNATKKP